MELIRTEALDRHVHGDGQVDELGGLAERLGDGRDGGKVNVCRERTEDRVRRSESGNVLRRNIENGDLPEHGGKRGHREDEPFFSGGIDAIWLRRTLS